MIDGRHLGRRFGEIELEVAIGIGGGDLLKPFLGVRTTEGLFPLLRAMLVQLVPGDPPHPGPERRSGVVRSEVLEA